MEIHTMPGGYTTIVHAQSVDEPPSVMVSSGGLETALVSTGRHMFFLGGEQDQRITI
jgi:hypothetical protein